MTSMKTHKICALLQPIRGAKVPLALVVCLCMLVSMVTIKKNHAENEATNYVITWRLIMYRPFSLLALGWGHADELSYCSRFSSILCKDCLLDS